MSSDDTTPADRALSRLRVAQAAADTDPSAVDDDALLAVAHGELPPDQEAAVMGQLAASAGLRAYLREVSRPVDEARAAAALDAMAAVRPPAAAVDPFDDPLAPQPPAYAISGPSGRIQAHMDRRAPDATAADAVPVFGPDSVLEWIIRAPDASHMPAAVSLWRRALGGRYTRAPDPTVEASGAAMRLSITARALFPAAGVWQVALVVGEARPVPGAASGQSAVIVRFDDAPERSP